MLVALRHWQYHWAHRRCVVHISGDNMAALAMITKMQTHSQSLGVVAREMALDISNAVYEPETASHVPGVAKVAADKLSRKFEPTTVPFSLPPVLSACTEVHPPDRPREWWRSLASQRSYTAEDKGRQMQSSTMPSTRSQNRKRKNRST